MNKDVTNKYLRKFGIALGIILAIIGTIQLLKGHIRIYPWLYAVGILSFVLGIFIPAILKPLYFVFTKIAQLIGSIITGLLLGVVFYVILTPIGLIARLFGKNFLDINWDRRFDTYWVKKGQTDGDVKRYEKQF